MVTSAAVQMERDVLEGLTILLMSVIAKLICVPHLTCERFMIPVCFSNTLYCEEFLDGLQFH